jgi:lipid A 4'-phosphatase
MGLLGSVERHPWRWALALFLPVVLFPQIELGLSGLFFDPVRKIFLLRSHPLGEFVRKILPGILFVLAAAAAVAGGLAAWRKRPLLGMDGRRAIFLAASLGLGPGLVVNVLLKDFWGRPRPSTIAEFSGPFHYVRALIPSDQCLDNCSFPSGHAALGFWMVAFALLAPPARRRPAVVAAVVFGALVGLVRIAQGGHFLSDVIASGIIVTALCIGLHRLIIVQSSMTFWKNIRHDGHESL